MIKKILSYFLIAFGLLVLGISTSKEAMRYIITNRNGNQWWSICQWNKGDLVGMAHLDIINKFESQEASSGFKRVNDSFPKNTNLYIFGDSYARYLKDFPWAFSGVNYLKVLDKTYACNYHLDSSKRNILLIEITERHIRYYFSDTRMLEEIYDSIGKKRNLTGVVGPHTKNYFEASILPDLKLEDFFNKNINPNLQHNLFNYQFLKPFFQVKAAINYYLFSRADGDVVVSNDGNFLFLKETVDRYNIVSSYYPVTNDEINNLTNNINIIYNFYKKGGFDEVYLSIIPNPATIVQHEGYNNLIPLIQNNPALKMKIIDIYSVFRNTHGDYYLPGDTHWNLMGKQLWIDLVNKSITE